jgi:hypothetical protein
VGVTRSQVTFICSFPCVWIFLANSIPFMCPRVGRVSEAILPHHFPVRNRNWRRHLRGTRCCRTVMLMVSSICRFIQWYALLSIIYSMWTPIFPIDYLYAHHHFYLRYGLASCEPLVWSAVAIPERRSFVDPFPHLLCVPFFLNERHCCLPFSCFPFPFLTQVCSSITFTSTKPCVAIRLPPNKYLQNSIHV